MIRNSRRVVVLAIAGAFAIAPVISGCGAGTRPQSAAPTQLTEGVNASVPRGDTTPQVDIRNMFLLGPRSDQMLTQGSSLPLYATIINQVEGRQDRLVSVSSPDFGPVQITGGAVTLPAAQPSGEGTPVTLVGQAPQAPQPGRPQPGQAEPGRTPEPGQATPTGRATATPSRETPTRRAQTEPASSPTPVATSPGAAASDPAATATPTPPPGAATAQPSNAPVQPGGKAPLVVLSNLNLRQVLGGEAIRVRLQFEHAGSIDIFVPVVPQQGEYIGYTAVSAGVPVPGGSPLPGGTGESPASGGHN